MNGENPTQEITREDWARLGKLANISPEEMQSRYESAIAEHPGNLRSIEVKVTDANRAGDNDCITKDFEISLFKIVGLKGTVSFCGTSSSDWTATFNVCLELAGSSVWCTTYTLSPTDTSICFHPDLAAVKADLCIGIIGNNHCFNINGKACYWAFGWHCADFNETLFCFG